MAITIVGTPGTTTQTSAATIVGTLGATPASTSLIVVIAVGVTATAGWTAPNVGSNAWTFQSMANSNLDLVAGWVPSDGSTTSFTFTETNQAGSAWNQLLWIAEVTGLVLASSLDKTNNGAISANATSAATSTAATTVANELWIAAAAPAVSGSATFSAGTANGGFSVQSTLSHISGGGPNSQGLIVATDIVSATGTPSSTVGWTTAAGLGGSWGVITLKGLATLAPAKPDVTANPAPRIYLPRPRLGHAPNSAPPVSRTRGRTISVNKALVIPSHGVLGITPRAPALPPPHPRITVNHALVLPARVAPVGVHPRPPQLLAARARITANRALVQPARRTLGRSPLAVVVVPPRPPRPTVTRNVFRQPTRTLVSGRMPLAVGNRLVNLN